MDLIGILIGFSIILFLNSKKIDMGISLLTGALTAGFFSKLNFAEIGIVIFNSLIDPLTVQLIIVVATISGLGYILKETGDLNQMIDSLVRIIKNGKILSMVLPALVGTLAVPGGAILSAPMIDESGDRIKMNSAEKTADNLFFRHIGFLVYPLYSALILTSDLSRVGKTTIVKFNFLIMIVGILSAYYVLFKKNKLKKVERDQEEDNKKILTRELINFFLSFSPILSILILALFLQLPFYIAVFAGVLIAIGRNLPEKEKLKIFFKRTRDFFMKGVEYNLIGLLAGVMAFKAVVEASGAVNEIANFLTSTGLPISLMIIFLGVITGLLTGINLASLGILIPIFLPLIPPESMGPYISLLFTSSFIGYLFSPIHLCLVLTKEYFKIGFIPVYHPLIIPSLLMIFTGVIQVIIF